MSINDLSALEREILSVLFPPHDLDADWSADTLDQIAQIFEQDGYVTEWQELHSKEVNS